MASNFTYCGISPILNETLGKVTADQGFEHYRDYAQSTIWSWGTDEPRNSAFGDESRTNNRCAVLNATSGSWQTGDCAESHYSACRYNSQPYQWTISNSDASYTDANIGCKSENEFTAPRTALENSYLLHSWRQAISVRGINDNLLWVDFNDLDYKGCWVVGQNSTCPYIPQTTYDRKVVIPTVAAVIVFVLAALTVFVKCAANRLRSKRRRRGDDGWDYEGVPS